MPNVIQKHWGKGIVFVAILIAAAVLFGGEQNIPPPPYTYVPTDGSAIDIGNEPAEFKVDGDFDVTVQFFYYIAHDGSGSPMTPPPMRGILSVVDGKDISIFTGLAEEVNIYHPKGERLYTGVTYEANKEGFNFGNPSEELCPSPNNWYRLDWISESVLMVQFKDECSGFNSYLQAIVYITFKPAQFP